MDGTVIATQAVDQGGYMRSNTLTNVRTFPVREPDSWLEAFLLKHGAKEMVASTKKETDGAIATKWNNSVLGLAATLLVLVSALVTVVVSYTNLSADFRNYQKATDEKFQRVETEKNELKLKIEKVEDWQRQDSLQKAKVQGFELGAAETKAEKERHK